MEINIENIDDIKVISIEGDIDASVGNEISQTVLPLATENAKIILDMTKVPYMASAGLRFLLSMYRQVSAKKAKLILVGLSEDLKDTMDVTGFLDFFEIEDSVESAVNVLK